MAKAKKVQIPDKDSKLKEMEKEVTKSTKDFTKEVKSIGKKYDMILDVKVLINYKSENT
jgi:hypothetical protein